MSISMKRVIQIIDREWMMQCGETHDALGVAREAVREYAEKKAKENERKKNAAAYAVKYREEHKEKIKEYQKMYYQQNKDRLREYLRKYREEHPEYWKYRCSKKLDMILKEDADGETS